jgi:hypothetical protein
MLHIFDAQIKRFERQSSMKANSSEEVKVQRSKVISCCLKMKNLGAKGTQQSEGKKLIRPEVPLVTCNL